MNAMAILALVAKGLTIADVMIATGKSAAPALAVVKRLVMGGIAGTVTDEQLEKDEAALDGLIDRFNAPI